jgi:chromosomal replication initiation ATPase DnaA
MRSPKLRAKQQARRIIAAAPSDRQIESGNAEAYAHALIREARAERSRLLTAARKSASALVDGARSDAERLISEAKAEVERLVRDARNEARVLIEMAEQGTADLPPRPAVRDIIKDAAERTGVSVSDIVSHRRAKGINVARREAMAAVYQQRPDLSLPQLGRLFGGRDHTTILHAVRKAGVYRGGAK